MRKQLNCIKFYLICRLGYFYFALYSCRVYVSSRAFHVVGWTILHLSSDTPPPPPAMTSLVASGCFSNSQSYICKKYRAFDLPYARTWARFLSSPIDTVNWYQTIGVCLLKFIDISILWIHNSCIFFLVHLLVLLVVPTTLRSDVLPPIVVHSLFGSATLARAEINQTSTCILGVIYLFFSIIYNMHIHYSNRVYISNDNYEHRINQPYSTTIRLYEKTPKLKQMVLQVCRCNYVSNKF